MPKVYLVDILHEAMKNGSASVYNSTLEQHPKGLDQEAVVAFSRYVVNKVARECSAASIYLAAALAYREEARSARKSEASHMSWRRYAENIKLDDPQTLAEIRKYFKNLDFVHLRGCNIESISVYDLVLPDLEIEGSRTKQALIRNVRLNGAVIPFSHFQEVSILDDCRFEDVNALGLDAEDVGMQGLNVNNSILDSARLSGDASGAVFRRSYLRKARLLDMDTKSRAAKHNAFRAVDADKKRTRFEDCYFNGTEIRNPKAFIVETEGGYEHPIPLHKLEQSEAIIVKANGSGIPKPAGNGKNGTPSNGGR
ncbi:MAG: pentapeptide repeat-containing protein [Candidatus Aenigmarchaeota archaeon]|nr:pentapeptide repeat-containing protein [Candidatus Aenigmarchaeota archaeon]